MMKVTTSPVDRIGKKASLYRNPNNKPHLYVPRNLNSRYGGNYTFIDPAEREQLAQYGLDLYTSLPSLGSAINAKNSWAFAQGWKPFFKGQDREWGKLVSSWWQENVVTNCNVLGPNYNFNRTLAVMGISYDIFGEVCPVFVTDRDSRAKIALIPSQNIGTRGYNVTVMEEGRYKGNKITDGVIVNSQQTPIAYHILASKETQDYDLSARAGMLLFSPEQTNQHRGVSIIARPLLSLLNVQDIESYMSTLIKRESQVGVIASTETGTGEEFGSVGEDDGSGVLTNEPSVSYMTSEGGEMFFVNSTTGEKLEPYRTDRPHSNAQDFIYAIEERALYSVGWPLPLISTQKISSVAARGLEAQVRQTIKERQEIIKHFAKAYLSFAISKGIEAGEIPANNSADWRQWEFSTPGLFTIDSYYSEQSDREGWKIGSTSLQEIAAKKGEDWQELRQQREIEDKDLIERASNLVAHATAKGQELSFERALDMCAGKTTNAAPVQEQNISAVTTQQ